MRPALYPSKPPNNGLHLKSLQVVSTAESKVDSDENCDIQRHHVNDPGKPSNTEPLNETPNPLPCLIISASWSSTSNLLMQSTPDLSTTLVSLHSAPILTPRRPKQKVSSRDSHLNRPTTVGDLPLNPNCTLSIRPLNGSPPTSQNSNKSSCQSVARR